MGLKVKRIIKIALTILLDLVGVKYPRLLDTIEDVKEEIDEAIEENEVLTIKKEKNDN